MHYREGQDHKSQLVPVQKETGRLHRRCRARQGQDIRLVRHFLIHLEDRKTEKFNYTCWEFSHLYNQLFMKVQSRMYSTDSYRLEFIVLITLKNIYVNIDKLKLSRSRRSNQNYLKKQSIFQDV